MRSSAKPAGSTTSSSTTTSTRQPTPSLVYLEVLSRGGPVIARIDDLLDKVDSKYTLVHLAARRAREINNYYHSLGEGLGQYTPPLVEQVDSNKPLSIALEEIAAGKIVVQMVGDARQTAEELLGGAEAGEAQILSLDTEGEDEDR
ncbi:MAG TPA: DNA-directed RNA polymerase subunit omega [Egibacteraceae bacterium]|nr:DNA-directed RNA polymerase subunit omega [Egibacteraceae bacterium]